MEKEEIEEKAKKEVLEVVGKIEVLKLEMKNATDIMKDRYRTQMTHLEEKGVILERKYHDLADIAEDKWEEAKNAFKTRAENVKSIIKNLFD